MWIVSEVVRGGLDDSTLLSHGGRHDSRSADEMMSREICQPQLQPPNCHLSGLPHLACNELQIYCGGTKLAALRFNFRLRESFSCRIN